MKDCINSYINYLDLNIEVHNDYIDQLMKEIDDLYNTWPEYELKATPQAN